MPNPDEGADTLTATADATDADAKAVQAQTEATNDGAGGEGAEQPKKVFGKFTSIEEAEKGYKELERSLTEVAQGRADAKREVESLRAQADLKSLLTEIVKVKQESAKTPVDFDAFARATGEKFLSDPAAGVKEMLAAVSTWNKQDRDSVAAEVKELKALLLKQQEMVEDRVERVDPFYEKNKAMIDRLTSDGMKLSKAKSFVREMVAAAGDEGRDAPPPKITSARVKSEPPAVQYFDTADERAAYVAKFGEDVTKKMEDEFAENYRREQAKARK
jgi:hypothetical protein